MIPITYASTAIFAVISPTITPFGWKVLGFLAILILTGLLASRPAKG